MRLAGQAKGGFYAAHLDAIQAVLARIEPTPPCVILDPCCGLGEAVTQLAEGLRAEPFAIELADDRAETVRATVRDSLAPADFLRTSITPGCFSLVWLNPPFDYETGSMGRTEHHFMEATLPLLVEGGVLALCCPESVASNWQTLDWFGEHFDNVSALRFPEHCRHYNEVVVFGEKLAEPRRWGHQDWQEALGRDLRYVLPPGRRPAVFRKSEPTDSELRALLASSPLQLARNKPTWYDKARPPMSPGQGHMALLLASGHINGLVSPEGEPPHVVRGSVTKEEYLASISQEEDEKGRVTTRQVYAERIKLLVRTCDSNGRIATLTEGESA